MYNYVYNNPKSMYIPVICRDTIMYVCVFVHVLSFHRHQRLYIYFSQTICSE